MLTMIATLQARLKEEMELLRLQDKVYQDRIKKMDGQLQAALDEGEKAMKEVAAYKSRCSKLEYAARAGVLLEQDRRSPAPDGGNVLAEQLKSAVRTLARERGEREDERVIGSQTGR